MPQVNQLLKKIAQLEKNTPVSLHQKWLQIMQQKHSLHTPLKAEISICSACNQNCVHCSYGSNHSFSFLSLDTIDEILKLQPGYIVLTGGEPLLHPEFLSILNKIKNTNAIVKICTNGSCLTSTMVDKISLIIDKFDTIQISFDALDETQYRKIRGIDHFKQVVNSIEYIKNRYPWMQLELHCVPTMYNLFHIIDIYKFACRLKVNAFSLAPLAHLGNALHMDLVDPIKLVDLHYKILCLAQHKKVIYIGRPYEIASLYGKIKLTQSTNSSKTYSCSAGYQYIYIDCLGNVYPCVYMQYEKFNMGNIKNGANEIINAVPNIIPKSISLKNSPCNNCYLWEYCMGACIGLSFNNINQTVPGFDIRCARKKQI